MNHNKNLNLTDNKNLKDYIFILFRNIPQFVISARNENDARDLLFKRHSILKQMEDNKDGSDGNYMKELRRNKKDNEYFYSDKKIHVPFKFILNNHICEDGNLRMQFDVK